MKMWALFDKSMPNIDTFWSAVFGKIGLWESIPLLIRPESASRYFVSWNEKRFENVEDIETNKSEQLETILKEIFWEYFG